MSWSYLLKSKNDEINPSTFAPLSRQRPSPHKYGNKLVLWYPPFLLKIMSFTPFEDQNSESTTPSYWSSQFKPQKAFAELLIYVRVFIHQSEIT